MMIFERLTTQDYSHVYYIIKCREKDIFRFYIPPEDEETFNRICLSEDDKDAFFDVYITLSKSNREELPIWFDRKDGKGKQSMIDWKAPIHHRCICFSYKELAEKAKERAAAGRRIRVALAT